MAGDQRVDELFALPPDDFTRARDELVKELRAAGDRERAAAVKALRRPTLAAWALNRLARQDPDGLVRLREAGEALAHQQRRVLSGLDASGMRAAQETRRQVTDQLLQRTLALLMEAGVTPDPHVDALRGALDAAAVEAETSEALREGRLSRPPQPPSGFGAFTALSPVAEDEPAADEPPADEPPTDEPDADEEAARQRLAEARDRLEAAQAEARARRDDADTAAEQAQRTAEDVQRLEDELAQARRRNAAAGTRAQAARKRAEEADADVAGRQQDVAQAEADLTS